MSTVTINIKKITCDDVNADSPCYCWWIDDEPVQLEVDMATESFTVALSAPAGFTRKVLVKMRGLQASLNRIIENAPNSGFELQNGESRTFTTLPDLSIRKTPGSRPKFSDTDPTHWRGVDLRVKKIPGVLTSCGGGGDAEVEIEC